MKKNKGLIITIVVIVLVALWGILSYNGLVGMDENVSNQWANVETQYQRRSDLIPNLVNTVKGYAKHESQTLEAVMAARSQATQVKIDPSNCTPQQLAAYQKAQGDVTTALGKLLAITENYPDLKANQNFLELQSQLEGTPRMKKLTYSQGKLLIKLVYRECDSSSYQLVQAFLGPIRAGFYQAFAALFGASLMKKYDPNGVDRYTERIVRQVEAGQI